MFVYNNPKKIKAIDLFFIFFQKNVFNGTALYFVLYILRCGPIHWKGNVILTKFSSLEIVILAASDENFIKLTSFPFLCTSYWLMLFVTKATWILFYSILF